jgi:hypothetical protein
VKESGRPAAQARGVRFVRVEQARAVLAVDGGTYAFTARWGAN